MAQDRQVQQFSQDEPVTWKRPEFLEGYTLRLKTPSCGSFFLTLNEENDKLCEIRCLIGKSGNCVRTLFETISILISVLLQSNISREKIAKTIQNQLDANCGNRIYHEGEEFTSCVDYMVKKILEDLVAREGVELG